MFAVGGGICIGVDWGKAADGGGWSASGMLASVARHIEQQGQPVGTTNDGS
jgi:hypothetical protein